MKDSNLVALKIRETTARIDEIKTGNAAGAVIASNAQVANEKPKAADADP